MAHTPKTRRSTRRWLTAGAAGAATLAAVGAGAAGSAGAQTKQASRVPLVVYSAQGYDSAMTKAFQAATGIPVSLDDNSTGPLLTQIAASRNNPKWGLLWVDGATAFASLDSEHLLLRGYEPKVRWNALGSQAAPADESYVPTGVTLAGAMAYNSAKVPNPPATWTALESSAWKGQVGSNDPSQSGPTYPFIAGMMNHLGSVSAGEAFFNKLKANGLVINPTNGPTLAALASGQINVALVQSSAAVGATFTDSGIKVKYLNPVTILPSAIGIDAKMPKVVQQEAKEFAAFVLSPAGQHVMQTGDPQGDSLYYPVVKGISPLPALPSLNGVKTQNIDPYLWGPKENSINAWYDARIVQ